MRLNKCAAAIGVSRVTDRRGLIGPLACGPGKWLVGTVL